MLAGVGGSVPDSDRAILGGRPEHAVAGRRDEGRHRPRVSLKLGELSKRPLSNRSGRSTRQQPTTQPTEQCVSSGSSKRRIIYHSIHHENSPPGNRQHTHTSHSTQPPNYSTRSPFTYPWCWPGPHGDPAVLVSGIHSRVSSDLDHLYAVDAPIFARARPDTHAEERQGQSS